MIFDFHVHTKYSFDSIMEPKKILKTAKDKKLNGIVICDHNTIKGGLEVKKLNTDKDFFVIVGAEIETNGGDITGIFLTQEIKSREVNEVIREIKRQKGKVILNHPFKGHNLSLIDFSQIDYIEGFNSRLNMEANKKAIELAKEYNIPIIAGSDAHLYNEIGNCITFVDNIEKLQPIKCEYKSSTILNVVISQYIKSFKMKSIHIFISATIVFLKKIIRNKSL